MGDLPEELLLEILIRVPVESLVQFKCVCKSWCALLESKKFVSKHIANQSKDHVILMHNAGGNFMSFLSNTCKNYADEVSCIVDSDMNLRCPTHDGCCNHLSMYGYCDGIVVLSDFHEVMVVCNPTIRELTVLPKSSSFLWYISSGENPFITGVSSIGFGYDPKTEDYKVIRVMAFWADENYSVELPDRAEVFSLRTDSAWREIEGVVGAQLCVSDDLEQYFEGVHYWMGTDEETQKPVVVSFDLADEVFQKAPVPDVCDSTETLRRYLGVFKNESMALFVWPSEGFEKSMDVWVMKEFGVKESWTKQLTIGPLIGLERPLVFWKNDKELLQEDRCGELVSFDLSTLESIKLPFHHEIRTFLSWRAYLFKKTLVSFKRSPNNTV